ncbi:50S ribosomal protein L29 [Dactylococcopsis salina]|uniref:Large ribosomal subunit protein uL29 n=1 Tax=Dactylococcopsis salina (strain PCC 8305) TaxID=13035 RepID=K9Z083_DACS8|nr:50S ribosomal protein L29 [Dactylococcopsis salina]AFZ52137.1 ribosomal protein L29 [Dactylococcopsis salina PCC 8305]
MPLPKIDEARALNDEDLAQAIVDAKRELFNLRFKQGTRQEEQAKPHEFKHLRRRIAHLLTVERERELAKTKTTSLETVEESSNNDN